MKLETRFQIECAYRRSKRASLIVLMAFCVQFLYGQDVVNESRDKNRLWLDSEIVHEGSNQWKMIKAVDVLVPVEQISSPDFSTKDWLPAIVPDTVLNSLVYNQKYPEPYYEISNKLESKLIPDINKAGRDFYTYWFRTEFTVPQSFMEKNIWLQLDAINYRAEVSLLQSKPSPKSLRICQYWL